MVRPQAADGGTASDTPGSCEYIEYAVADSRQAGYPAWDLGEVLATPHRRNVYCYVSFARKA